MMELRNILTVSCLIASALSDSAPIVTLSHGGQMMGLKASMFDTPLDLFLGVRYAQPPVGKLRFKKPVGVPAWTGVEDATKVGNMCPQQIFKDPGKFIGDEDCLYLDMTIPGGVKQGAKKPVMVWIHGGGYQGGSGIAYLGGALAVTGDVIVVTINYRLGVLGFLTVGKGTGNYGLWDQRAAIIWVKENIAQFGGDPDMITIFGESAGGGSVSSQIISPHNDGLFKRAITQSGTAFMMFGMSENSIDKVDKAYREQTKCDPSKPLFDCFKDLTAMDILSLPPPPAYMVPTADDDFFAAKTTKELSYSLSHRYDLMAGFNGQEGGLMYMFELAMIAQHRNKSEDVNVGVGVELLQGYLAWKCLSQFTPLSPGLCVDFIMNTYELDTAVDDRERAVRITEFLGESLFNADTVNQLEQHSSSDKSTYAYYFTEEYKPDPPNPLWHLPDWLKTKADHGDELPYMFGFSFLPEEIEKNSLWLEILLKDPLTEAFMGGEDDKSSEKPLAGRMMKIWTNFARTGNPNIPASVSPEIPLWPEFNTKSNWFMELNSKQARVVPTPHKERLEKFRNNLSAARHLQTEADKRPVDDPGCKARQVDERDEL